MKNGDTKEQINDLMNQLIELCAQMCDLQVKKMRILGGESTDTGDSIDCDAAVTMMKECAQNIRSLKGTDGL